MAAAAGSAPAVDPFAYTLPTKEKLQALWDAGYDGEDEFLLEVAAAFYHFCMEANDGVPPQARGGIAHSCTVKVFRDGRKARPTFRPQSLIEIRRHYKEDEADVDKPIMLLQALAPESVKVRPTDESDYDDYGDYLHDDIYGVATTLIDARVAALRKENVSHRFVGTYDERGRNMDYRAGEFHEEWGNWDLCHPSDRLTLAEIADPPKESFFNDRALLHLMGLLRQIIRVYRETPDFQLNITHGPTPVERYAMWQPVNMSMYSGEIGPELKKHMDERNALTGEQRRRLATYLQTLPGVLVDMKHDPVCPWKGMKFFHGNNYKFLQSQTAEEIAANAQSSKNYNVCQLDWSTPYKDADGNPGISTAFTTPYHTKSFTYGKHVYTYRLSVDGKELRMLDLRNDYLPETHNNPELDPFHLIWELAGIKHGNSNRVEKARQLQRLFKDSGVHGAIINADVEWVWFDPSSVLEWVPPNPNDGVITSNPGLTAEQAELKDRVSEDDEDEFLKPAEYDTDSFDPENYSFERVLFNTLGLDRPVLWSRTKHWIDDKLDAVVETGAGAVNDAIDAVLSTISTVEDVPLSDLPIVRWKLDATVEGYMPQFVPTREDHVKRLPSQWVAYQYTDKEKTITVHTCKSRVFWNQICPALADVWMADPVVEGGAERHESLVYRMLVEKLQELEVHVLFELPNGFHQLIPRVTSEELDSRLYQIKKAKFPRPSDARVKRVDLPFRSLFQRRMQITTEKRGRDDDGEEEEEKQSDRANPALYASAAAAAPSKTRGRKIRYCIM